MLLHERIAQQDGSTTIGELYEVTKKPRGMDLAQFELIPFVPMDAIPQGGAFAPRYDMKPSAESGAGTYFEKCDVLVGKITPSFENGKQALVCDLPSPFGFATTEVIPLRPKSPDHDRRLLFYYLLHPDVRSFVAGRMEGATGRKRVPEDVLLELPFPEFGSDEEQAISNCLSIVRSSIDIEERLVRELAGLKRAAMRELFTRGTRGEAQKDSEIGPVPENWEVVPFSELVSVPSGLVDPKNEPYASLPHIGPENIEQNGSLLQPLRRAKDLNLISGKYLFAPGQIIYSKIRPYLNKAVMVDFSGVCSADMYPLNVDAAFDPQYVFALLRSRMFVDQAIKDQGRTGIPKLNREQLYAINAPKPGLDEQREIGEIASAIDAKIDLHTRKKAVLEELFRALLHKLMTGEIQVADLDLSALEPAQEVAA